MIAAVRVGINILAPLASVMSHLSAWRALPPSGQDKSLKLLTMGGGTTHSFYFKTSRMHINCKTVGRGFLHNSVVQGG